MPAANRIDAARVRELLAKGCTQKQLAQRLGCSKSVVSVIASGDGKDRSR